ncbi:MAG: AI-2E family transporter, partial [Planctomycetaceae bacterium]|nr:AI-2E family transporter [Planctomycetaceae bacterium]
MFRIVSLSIVLTLIVVLGITFFRVVSPYLMPLFVAGVAAILAQPLFQYFVRRTNGKVRLASGLATATVVLAILLPVAVGTAIASLQLTSFALDVTSEEKWDKVLGSVQHGAQKRTDSATQWLADLINNVRSTPLLTPRSANQSVDEPQEDQSSSQGDDPTEGPAEDESPPVVGVEFPSADRTPITAEQIQTLLRSKAQELLITLGDRSLGFFKNVVFSLISAIVALLIFTVALYYFFADGTALIAATERLVPVHVQYQREMLDQFARVVRAVVSATFLAALGQALATTVALWLCGFNHLVTLFALCLLSSMIPMLGTWLVWLPCAVILAVGQSWVPAVLLSVYGAAVVGTLDNLIR